MLRSRYRIIGFLLISIALAGLLSSRACYSQEWRDVAPWRIENEDDVEPSGFGVINVLQMSLDDLMQIPGMTEEMARLILENRELVVSQLGYYELISLLQREGEGIKDLKAIIAALQGGENFRFSYRSRYQYVDPSPEVVGKSPYRIGEKVIVDFAGDYKIGIALEKDPGEELFWDHNAFSLKARLPSDRGYFVIGDYICRVGHGLLISTRRSFGIGGNVPRSLIFDSKIIKDYISWAENIALRGGAVALNYKSLEIDAWASQRHRDAHLDDEGNVTSFSFSGLHRTESEMEGSDACIENALGARIGSQLFGDRLNLGITHAAVKWDRGVYHNENLLTATNVSGSDLRMDWDEVQVSVETAFDDRGHYGMMGTLRYEYDRLQQVYSVYHFQPDYYSPLSSSLDFDYGEVGNREGVYSHLKLTWRRGSLQGFTHLYRYPRRAVDQEWGGKEFYLNGTRHLAREILMGFSSRWTQEEDAYDNENMSRWRGSTFIYYQFKKRAQIRAKVHLCTTEETFSPGRLFELGYSNSWHYSPNLYQRLYLKAGLYRADDYAQRLYWYESDSSPSFRFRPLWKRGVILQIQTSMKHSMLGCLELSMIWDQPDEASGRHASRTLKIVYRYN
jgi:hypothetical protein